MSGNRPSTFTAFQLLPIEINQQIALCLKNDKDVAAFSSTCLATAHAVYGDNLSLFRRLFRDLYALPSNTTSNRYLARLYQYRKRKLNQATRYDFYHGNSRREQEVILLLCDLILQAFQGDILTNKYGKPDCMNLHRLHDFVEDSMMLLADRRTRSPTASSRILIDRKLLAVKLACTPFLFHIPRAVQEVYGFEEIQRRVYFPTNKAPIFTDEDQINLDWTLSVVKFFQHHMLCKAGSYEMYNVIKELPGSQRPSPWRGILQNGAQPLSRFWKYTFAFLKESDLHLLRFLGVDQTYSRQFYDEHLDEGRIDTLEFDFAASRQTEWPAAYEAHLNSLRLVHGEEQEAASMRFKGSCIDGDFEMSGWLNPLPSQGSVPGWNRVTFMKRYPGKNGGPDILFAHEGVVIPGGRMMVGRWWDVNGGVDLDRDYNGPFILWAVDELDE